MERLTKSGAISGKDINELLDENNENQMGKTKAYYKLQEYEDLEEQGSLVILPCKYVYYIVDINNSGYAKVAKRFIKVLSVYEIENIDKENCKYFSTKEKAEAKLKELRGGE